MDEASASYQRVELPGIGLAVAFPPGWDVEIEMDYGEMEAGDPETGFWKAVYADGGGGTWCDVTQYVTQLGDLEGLVPFTAQRFAEEGGEAAEVQWGAISLPLGDAYRIDVQDPGKFRFTTLYIFDAGTARFNLNCMTDERDARDWMDIAETLELLAIDDETGPAGELPESNGESPRVEIPEAGLVLTLPDSWDYEIAMDTGEYPLPAGFGEGSTVPMTHVLTATAPDYSMDEDGFSFTGKCIVSMYEDMPMSAERHALEHGLQNTATALGEDPTVREVELSAGPAFRVDFLTMIGWGFAYLFDMSGTRYVLDCFEADPDEQFYWLIADSVEPYETAPPEVPAEAAYWSEVGPLVAQVPVVDGELEGSLMQVRCDRAVWIEFPDGTFEERLTCELSDDPVEPIEWQAPWPTQPVEISGGECEWISDFWSATDGSEAWASSWWVSADPAGPVSAVATYAAEELDCDVD